ncbi:MAG: hypothetical protein R6U43_10460 [Candidatus Krumholzibacteriales bacterium]
MGFLQFISSDGNRSWNRWILVFFIRFLFASIILYLLYMKLGIYYARLICHGARPLVALFGHRVMVSRALLITEDISLNPVVFLSLVIAVTNIPVMKKVRGAVIGVVILTLANSLTVSMAFLSYYRGSEALWTGTEFFNLTINFFLPLFLAFALLPVKSALPAGWISKENRSG